MHLKYLAWQQTIKCIMCTHVINFVTVKKIIYANKIIKMIVFYS